MNDLMFPTQRDPLDRLFDEVKHIPSGAAADIIKKSRMLGMPTQEVAQNYEGLNDAIVSHRDYAIMAARSPRTAEWLQSDPYYAAAMREKLTRLEEIEGSWKPWRKLKEETKSVARGIIGGVIGSVETFMNSPQTPDAYISNEIGNVARLQPQNFGEAPSVGAPYPQPMKRAETLRSAINSDWLRPGIPVTSDFGGKVNETLLGNKTWGDLGYGVIGMIPQIVGQVAAFALGGPVGSFSFNTAMIGGGQYLDLTEDGADPQRAFVASMGNALTQAFFEQISINRAFKALPKGTPAVNRFKERVEAGLTEGMTEWAQKFPEAAAELWAKNPGKGVTEVSDLMADDIVRIMQEGLFEGLVAAPFGVLGRSVSLKMQEKSTERYVKNIERMQQQLAKSEVVSVSPEAAVAHLEAVTQNERAYLEPEALLTLYQSSELLSQDEIDSLLGISREKVEQAAATGELVELSLPQYMVAVAQKPEMAMLNEHLSATPDGMTMTYVKELNELDLKKAVQEEKRTREERMADAGKLKSAQKELYDEAVSAGMKPDEAGNLVAMFTANSRIYAAAKGQSHAQWFRENRPVIRKGREMVAGALGQKEIIRSMQNTLENELTEAMRSVRGIGNVPSRKNTAKGPASQENRRRGSQEGRSVSDLQRVIWKDTSDGRGFSAGGVTYEVRQNPGSGTYNVFIRGNESDERSGRRSYQGAVNYFPIDTLEEATAFAEHDIRRRMWEFRMSETEARTVSVAKRVLSKYYAERHKSDNATTPNQDELQLLYSLSKDDAEFVRGYIDMSLGNGMKDDSPAYRNGYAVYRQEYGLGKLLESDNRQMTLFQSEVQADTEAARQNEKAATPTGAGSQQQIQVLSDEQLAKTSPEAFVVGPDGTLDFGEIDSEYAKTIRRQAGKIRLQVGKHSARSGEGLIHIKEQHGAEISQAGYRSVEDFVRMVSAGFTEAFKGDGSKIIITKKDAGIKGVAVVELVPDTLGNEDFYKVKTAYVTTLDRKIAKEPFLPRHAPLDAGSDTGESITRSPKIVGEESVGVALNGSKHIIYQNQKNENILYQVAAWHGSPHTFGQFTTQKIGTGEGAQAYGWGMYFSSSKKVAEWYRDKLSRKKPAIFLNDNGTPMDYDQKRAAYFTPGHIVPSYGGFDKVIAYHPETGTQGWYVEVQAVVKKEGKWANDPQWEVTRTHSTEPSDDNIKSVLTQYGFPSTLDNEKGRLYEVTLAPDENDFLDWNKPIDQQSEHIQQVFNDNPYLWGVFGRNVDGPTHGQYFYEGVKKLIGEKQIPGVTAGRNLAEATSKHLLSLGIPGIRYKGNASGEHNFVVFDDSHVQINAMYQSAKGSIHWEDGKAVISLFKTADASTGIHELLGHYMTQNLLDWGSQDDAPDWMKQDRKTMLEWAGIEDWDSATKEQKVEAHEKWARAAEAYVMEGRAPSLELRDVFRRFADWMRQVYRAMRDMGVEIGPGMRGVFDRMLASEEEIAHASAVSEFMNENADLYVGLTDRQKESLAKQHDQIMERGKEVLLKELIGDINAERKQAMAAERERIEAEVRHEVSNQPFYRMVRELRKPAIRNPVNELTKEWQKKVDDMARYLRDHHGDGVENVKVYDGDIRDEQAKPEAYFRVSHNVKWYQDLYAELGKTPTLGDYKMLAEDFLRRGFEDLSGYVDPDVDFLEIEQQLEELQKTPQAIPMVQKINTAWLKENYPDELSTFAFMHSNLGQYDLEDLASFYRFSSADEIIWRMKNTPPLSRAIKDAVDARMNEAFPVLTNAEIAEKAEAAMHNEESVALLAVQLDLIREKAGQMRTAEESRKQALQDRELARVSAQKAMEKMPLERAMNLPVWIAAARRAAIKADKAIAEGNWVAAFEQKNIQLHNNAMIQESLNARREFDRVSRYLKRQQGSGKETWITDEAGPDGMVAKSDRHFAAAGEIMKRYGFGRRDAVEPKEPLSEYVRKMEEENPEMVSIADWIAHDVKGAPLRSLTIGKLRDVESALRNIKKMARAGKNADGFVTLNGDGLVMTVNNLVDAAEANVKDRQVDMPDKVAPSKMAEFMAGLRKPSKWLLELDGFKDFGAWAKAFYHALADATDLKSFLVNRALQKLEAAYQRAGIDKAQRYRDAHTKIYVPEWETSMSRNWMMAVLLNMGSESNMQRLFSRHPVGISVNTAWNRETVTTVLARELGANYFRLAQDIWDAIDVYDEYAAMVKKVTGATLQKVNPSPISFTTPKGETIHLRGGYYHLKADPRSSKQAELNAEKELGDTPGIMPYPNTGASKARAASASYSVDLDLTNIHQSVHSQAHDIAFRPVAIDINKLMRSEAVKEVFRRKLGDAAYKTFSKWLRVIESGKNAVESQGYMDPAANFFRQRAVVANLLFRVGTVFQNFANPALYGNAVEGFSNKDALMAYMKYGWGEYIPLALSFNAEAEAIRQEVFALSAMMRDKAENPDYTMRDMFDRQDGFMMNSGSAAAREVGARLKIGRDGVVKFGSGMLAFGDQLADIPVWRYAYHKALNEGRSEREAVRFADSVIENSTGTGRAVDSSMLQMGDPMEKLLSMFMTFVNTQYNRWANEYGIYMKEKDHARLLSFIGVQYLMFGALSAVFAFKGKKDDEELLEWFTKEVLEWPLSMIPIGGSLFKLAIDRSLGFQSYSWAMSPVERNLEQTAKLAVGAWQGKATAEDAMQTAAFLFGYPDQFNDWFWNAYDASTGNMDPELRDLVRRRPKRERR